jgi:predicted thioesterase
MVEIKPIDVGKSMIIQRRVTEEDASLNYGSGSIKKLFATPRLVAMMIEASSMLIDKSLPEGFVSIGKHLEVDHFKPTLIGGTVSVEVKVISFDETRVTLSMEAFDEVGKIGEGTHVRYLVNHSKLKERATAREKSLHE